LARDIAHKFNGDFNAPDFFPLPEPLILGQATRVMSLRDGSQKMSKSAPSDLSRITLNDTADDIAKKIRKAKTDPDALPETAAGLEGRPEAANLLGIFAALSDQSLDDAVAQFAGQQFSALKEQLTSVVIEKVAPITAEMNRLTDDPATIDAILADSAARARALAEPIMSDVRKLVGFLSN
jgi:tryptophanyl-tRNA synthetase